jgi:glycosyltransferase involved in cell wall biosynthesis
VTDHGGQITAEGLKLLPLKLSRGSKNIIKELVAFFEIVRIYTREKPNLVHHVGLKPILYGSLAARLANVCAVVNAFAGLGFVYTGTRWHHRILRSVVSLLLRMALALPRATTICQNPDDIAILLSYGVARASDSLVIRGSGVDPAIFSPVPEMGGEPVVLLAARMLWDKGIREFVEAARIIKGRGIHARFVLAGRLDPSNPTSVTGDRLRSWQEEGHVEWWGQREDMPVVLAQAHIVVLPSYREGLPKVLLEAAACERAIVATDVPGCREIVRNGDNGLLIPAKDPAALAEGIVTLLQNPELRRRMGMRGRQLVLNEFTVEHVAARVIQVYHTALRENSGWQHQ